MSGLPPNRNAVRDDPIDLAALDPDADSGAEERFVGAVMTRIAAQPTPYPVRVDVLWGAWSLARPVLIAASVVIVVAGVVLARASSEARRGPLTVAESLGVPPMFSVAGAPIDGGGPR
jgi:hypothetical protein